MIREYSSTVIRDFDVLDDDLCRLPKHGFLLRFHVEIRRGQNRSCLSCAGHKTSKAVESLII